MMVLLSARYIPNYLMFPTPSSYELLNRGDVVRSNSYVLSSQKCTASTTGEQVPYLNFIWGTSPCNET